MALNYYDDAIVEKLKKWIPENSNLRVLKPDETKRLFELMASDNNDNPLRMPFIALSRNTDITLLSSIKQLKSFNGARLTNRYTDNGQLHIDNPDETAVLNAIPVKLQYQLDIYTKTFDEGDEYLRNFLFKLINNPGFKITIPYNDFQYEHVAYIRVLDNISDTSSISERLFEGQFTRWTIQFEIHDAHFFNIPYKKNWNIDTEISVDKS